MSMNTLPAGNPDAVVTPAGELPVELRDEPPPSITQLLTGIIGDTRDLVLQNLQLFRSEMSNSLQEAQQGISAIAGGMIMVQIGGLLLCHMLVHGISYLYPDIPLWQGYAAIGGIMFSLGLIPIFRGLKHFQKISFGGSKTESSSNDTSNRKGA